MASNRIKGIYLIKVTTPEYVARYVGQAKGIYQRWAHHRTALRKGCEENLILQDLWNKYGSDAFKFSVLETCADMDLNIDDREKFWIGYHKSFVWAGEHGCNLKNSSSSDI